MIGVYSITNTKTGKMYIGSSKNIETRWKQHLKMLNNGTHHSAKLQRSYTATKDKSVFQLDVLEEVADETTLLDVEQKYIDKFDTFNSGYNCSANTRDVRFTAKSKTKAELKSLYAEFWSLYNEDYVRLAPVQIQRIEAKHYKHKTIRDLIKMMKWFTENYDAGNYYIKALYQKMQNVVGLVYERGTDRLVKEWLVSGKPYNKVDIGPRDLKILVDYGALFIDKDMRVHWNEDSNYRGVFDQVIRFVKTRKAIVGENCLIAVDD